MTYQDIGHLFFPLYLCACGLAMLLSVTRLRDFMLAAFYGFFVIFLFQMRFDGEAHHLAWRWYILVASVQGILAMVASLLHARAWKIVASLSLVAIALNAMYLVGHFTAPLPRQGYFVGVNFVQCLQIAALLFMSPVVHWSWKKARKVFSKRSTPWTQERAVISGRP